MIHQVVLNQAVAAPRRAAITTVDVHERKTSHRERDDWFDYFVLAHNNPQAYLGDLLEVLLLFPLRKVEAVVLNVSDIFLGIEKVKDHGILSLGLLALLPALAVIGFDVGRIQVFVVVNAFIRVVFGRRSRRFDDLFGSGKSDDFPSVVMAVVGWGRLEDGLEVMMLINEYDFFLLSTLDTFLRLCDTPFSQIDQIIQGCGR